MTIGDAREVWVAQNNTLDIVYAIWYNMFIMTKHNDGTPQIDFAAMVEQTIAQDSEAQFLSRRMMNEVMTQGMLTGVRQLLASDAADSIYLRSVDPFEVGEEIEAAKNELNGSLVELLGRIAVITEQKLQAEIIKLEAEA